jgi:hypothetical protein
MEIPLFGLYYLVAQNAKWSIIEVYIMVNPNWITLENQQAGTDTWRLTNPVQEDSKHGHPIAGYLSATSVNSGETLTLYAHSVTGACTFEVFRMGWYGGAGGRAVYGPVQLTGIVQPDPQEDARRMVECHWTPSAEITVGVDWTTGTYLIKLEATGDPADPATGQQSYVPFVVRDACRSGGIVYQNCVNTYQAYNSYAGRSLYPSGDPTQGLAVSFNRPYIFGYGASEYLKEYPMIRWLEREGYPVVYTTSIDTHFDLDLILRHKAWLSAGHDEYYSYEMRANLESAFHAGVSLAIVGGNPMFYQVRFEPGVNGPARTMVCYKSTTDPFIGRYDDRVTVRWRDSPVSRPEQAFLGVQYENYIDLCQVESDVGYAFPFVVAAADHWAFWGSGLSDGDQVPGTIGVEYDRVFPDLPIPNESTVLGRSPVTLIRYDDSKKPKCIEISRSQSEANCVISIELDTRAKLFAAGSIIYSWRLEDPGIEDTAFGEWQAAGPAVYPTSSALGTMMKNVLDHFLAGPLALVSLDAGAPSPTLDYLSSWRNRTVLTGLLPLENHVVCADILGRGTDQLVFLGMVDARLSVQLAVFTFEANGSVALYHSQPRVHGTWPLEGFADVTDKMVAGDFLGRDHDQLLLLNTSTNAGDGLAVVDFSADVHEPELSAYSEQGPGFDLVNRILGSGVLMVGDFAGLGVDQLFATTRVAGGAPAVDLVRFAADPATPATAISSGSVSLFDGWFDLADRAVAGDFLGLGHAQLALLNTSTEAGDGLLITDYESGGGWTQRHYEAYADSALRKGVRSALDLVVGGDFLSRGRDQILVISRGDRNVEPALAIYALDGGGASFAPIYQASWTETSVLDGWRNCALARVARRPLASSRLALLLT